MLHLLSDENFNGDIVRGLMLRRPALDLSRVQDVGLAEADDPTILAWAAANNRILLTHDRATMPDFAYARVVAGQPMPGVFVVNDRMSIRQATTDAELVAILVRVGFKGTSAVELGRQLLKQFGSLRAMVEAPVLALLEVKGLKGAKAAQLLAAMEIARRVAVPAQRRALVIKSTTGAAEYLRERMCALSEEQFRVLYLNRHYQSSGVIRRMLIVGCSMRKRSLTAGLRAAAGELYDGVAFRVIRAWKSRHLSAALTVLILSAKYGLVRWNTPLETYDLRMTKELGTQLRPQVESSHFIAYGCCRKPIRGTWKGLSDGSARHAAAMSTSPGNNRPRKDRSAHARSAWLARVVGDRMKEVGRCP